jgi:GMP synthase-like glutamine amidotransferase
MYMKLLVFQHIDCEHPGQLREYLRREGIDWHAVELDEGEPIPALDNFDALWVMGGPMDVWDTEEHPWLIAEKEAIRQWVTELKRPYLGLCLGHQLLADALGGRCDRLSPPEIGVLDVHLTEAGIADPIFADMPPTQQALQWHSVQVTQCPPNTTILAESDVCANQAMRVGDNAWSMQYHVEVEPDTVSTWSQVPAYRQALINTLGEEALPKMLSAASDQLPDFMKNSEILYNNFMRATS